ncbi:phospho-N-acetylmuramoyl-pentapeptide-transferase [Mitsuokella jalaludinii]|uniref:phospho-N-acetylmuramoyl-pentapeptide- transferase n=1 Tax=Mitsuokella jalaludinii TaxID=187979 RepID=UPI00242E6C1F|nr:phospho-N-acetylmuramoyl-pentapeptide-transferase [Mitsuokella jalaludinii]MCI6607851.1 phospho-N-acetylmuramoyl-pentapeptide-transferase [Mitsuokella jalaludinii]MCI6611994.1 phospho-N-acetylmuramoyl-pentapeptide-transferase [Mitsuokella jalaludinii]MCI7186433.1 phospho-N-acetylmuramoyl-pentapeptide-transferase [Mitsuokella jalaludinii]MCI7716863.1 phospho-N-acetylmuramoyl-pentapeptide-transferase [Mitsuokella jalaludinii]MDD7744927.1 phospho-N-acetylmuramoyl-pentapeptide-transferase [Mits
MDKILLAAIFAAGLVLCTGPLLIPELHKLKFGQSIREEGPKSHQAKSGTPTMGGIMIILAIVIATVAAAPLTPAVLLALFITLGHFVLGFLDDYIKVVKKRNLGLKAKQKMLGQILIAIVTMIVGTRVLGIDTTIWIPIADINLDIGVGYYFLVLFVLVGTSNAVNLTDGLDGLASGTVAIASGAYALVCYMTGHFDLAIFCVAMMMACVAFLRFNAHPAKVFMGDTGSLALGGAIAAVGILTHTEILLAVIGFVFVCEALSVIIQVISFKTTGKRVFRMSPIHHHFELGGWKETKVVFVFWMVGLVASVVGLLMMP